MELGEAELNTEPKTITLGTENLDLTDWGHRLHSDKPNLMVQLPEETKINNNHQKILNAIERKETIYGVTTGFGDSSRRVISSEHSTTLQKNLIQYLTCGTGPLLPKAVCRAVTTFRLNSLARGYSAVSYDLLKRMKWMVEQDVVPQIPSQGSLGASGDLVPLAYLARAVQGSGQVWFQGKSMEMEEVCKKYDLPPYQLKPKEGLALVNGTTVMAAYSFHNLKIFNYLFELATHSTTLCVLGMNGHKEAFNPLINSKAKQFSGQAFVANQIHSTLNNEDYTSPKNENTSASEERNNTVQDKYSLRCAPQILGPILDSLKLCENWTQTEASGVSDNPVIDEGEEFSMGGNFYGGYISHGMDYLKISLAHMADMIDRQFMCLIDESTNRGLPPNLANWDELPEELRFLNHGLKGLNQAMSAICSEVMAQSTPGGIFSRSSEAHNQDKVSLGLSACVQMNNMFDNLFTMTAIHLIGCAQALDLRNYQLKDPKLIEIYELVRSHSAQVTEDRSMDMDIQNLANALKNQSGAYDETF